MSFLHGRNLGSLVTAWVFMIGLAAGLYWIQHTMPALIDMLTPLYIILAVTLIVVTFRWLRGRSSQDRRHGDRRQRKSRFLRR